MITRSYKIHLFVVQRRDIYLNRFRGVFCDQLSMNSVSSGLERFNVIYLSTFSFYHTWTLSSTLYFINFNLPLATRLFLSIYFDILLSSNYRNRNVEGCKHSLYSQTLSRYSFSLNVEFSKFSLIGSPILLLLTIFLQF